MDNNIATAEVESTDSCRSRSVNENLVGSDFFAPIAKSTDAAPQISTARTEHDAKILSDIRKFGVILIDTCELMSPGLLLLLNQNAENWRTEGIKLSITPSVMVELYRNCAHKNAVKQSDAFRGWQLIGSPEYRTFFTTYPPSSLNTHADPNLLDAARVLKFKYETNVLVLTSDKNLTSSIFNAYCTKSLVDIGGEVQVLYIDNETGELTRYHQSRLEGLVDDVLLPEWSRIGKPSVKAKQERYFHDAIFNGSGVIDSSSLKYVLGSTDSLFMKTLNKTQALRPGQKFLVVSTSLYDARIREAVEAMPQMFNIIQAAHPQMREEDAILHSISEMSTYSQDKHILLISNKRGRYDAIARKLPTCYHMKEFWGCFIDPNTGYLLKSARQKNSTILSA